MTSGCACTWPWPRRATGWSFLIRAWKWPRRVRACPSFYALELPRAVEGSLPELKAFEDRARDAAPARLNWPAPKEAADAIDDAEYDLVAIAGARSNPGALRYLVEANPHVARSLRARWARWKQHVAGRRTAWSPRCRRAGGAAASSG